MTLKPPGNPNTPLGSGRIYYNLVSDYGARGDGVTSDHSPWNSASAVGGHIVVPPGTYRFTTMPNTVTASDTVFELQGAVIDLTSAPTGLTTWLNFNGSSATPVLLAANATKRTQILQVAGGSEPAEGVDILIGSQAKVNTGTFSAIDQWIGEYNTVRRPTGTLAAGISNADTTITLDNSAADARIGTGWPMSGAYTIQIGSEQITVPDAGTTVSTTLVTFTGCTRGVNSTAAAAHSLGDAVSLPSGRVALGSPLQDDYATADSASLAVTTFIERCGIIGHGKIIGGGLSNKRHVAIEFDKARDIRLSKDLELLYFDEKGIELRDVVESVIDQPRVTGGQSRQSSFVAIDPEFASQDLTINGATARDVRHLMTTDGNTSRFGITRRISLIGAHGVNNGAHSFDTHAGGEDMEFVGCTSLNPLGNGLSMRCPMATVTNFTCRNPGQNGIHLRNNTTRPSRYIVNGATIEDPGLAGLKFGDDTTALGNGYTTDFARFTDIAVTRARDRSIYIVGTNTRLHSVTLRATVKDSVYSGSGGAIEFVKVDDSTIEAIVRGHPGTGTRALKLIDCTGIKIILKAQFAALDTGIALRMENCQDCDVYVECATAGTGISLDNNCARISMDGRLMGCTTPLSLGTGAGHRVRTGLNGSIPSVASAATVTLPASSDVVSVTGTTNITSLTADYAGRRVTLIFTGVLTLTDGSNLKLAGNFVTSADDAITLVSDGTNWIQASPGSAN